MVSHAAAQIEPLSKLHCAALYGGQVQFSPTPRSTAAEAARLNLIGTYARDNGLLPDMVAPDVAAAKKSLHHELFIRVIDHDMALALCDKQFGFSVAQESNLVASSPQAHFSTPSDTLETRMQKWAKEPATGFVSSNCVGLRSGIRMTKSMSGSDIRDIARNAGCSDYEIDSMVANYEEAQSRIQNMFRQ